MSEPDVMATTEGTRESLAALLAELLEQGDVEALREAYDPFHAADFADALEQLPKEQVAEVLGLLDPAEAAEIVVELEVHHAVAAADLVPDEQLADVLDEMPSDEAADLLGELDPDESAQLLELMEDSESVDVERLLQHGAETAGGIMAAEVIALRSHLTADAAIEQLRRLHLDAATPYYLYVVDEAHHLIGVLSLRQLITVRGSARLSEFMSTNLITARDDEDQEDAARRMQRYDLVALPVVDADGRLVGVITADDAMEVIETELEEDFLRFAGTSEDTDRPRHTVAAAWYRLPVVTVCLLGDIWAGHAVLRYEERLIGTLAALTAFLPAMMATGGNIGQQSLAAVIRALGAGEQVAPNLWRAVAREAVVGLLMGLASGVVLGGVGYLWLGDAPMALLLLVALTTTSLLAAVLGVAVPLILERSRRDPTTMSGPLITTLNDIISTTVYFAMAVGLLRLLGHD